ncbi:MAG: OmpA family protein [Hydrogenophaga sp.]
MSTLDSSVEFAEAYPSAQSAPSVPSPSSRAKGSARCYSRWHLETAAPAEEEGWLLTYLDVITLILVLMVVMLSVAGPPSETGGKGVPNATTPPPDPLATTPAATVQKPSLLPPLPVTMTNPQRPETNETEGSASVAPPAPAKEAWASLKLDQIGQDVAVTPGQDSVRFRISNELLFGSGEARLIDGGHDVLDKLLPTLLADPDLSLVVEGHTDNVPISTARFPSNWELSTGRAASVARYLIERGVPPQRVRASGYADTQPLGSKNNPVDRNVNRRVELILEKTKPGD